MGRLQGPRHGRVLRREVQPVAADSLAPPDGEAVAVLHPHLSQPLSKVRTEAGVIELQLTNCGKVRMVMRA